MATSQAPKGADELAAENAAVGGGVTSRELIERSKANAIEKQAAKLGILPAEAQALIQQRRLQREIAVAIASETWGKDLSHDMCMAVASYCQQNKLDHSEIDILGGNLYRNAKYYKRRLAEAVEDGLVAYYRSDFIQKDARLEDAAAAGNEWASAESARRFRARYARRTGCGDGVLHCADQDGGRRGRVCGREVVRRWHAEEAGEGRCGVRRRSGRRSLPDRIVRDARHPSRDAVGHLEHPAPALAGG
jgi:hypothetical protein